MINPYLGLGGYLMSPPAVPVVQPLISLIDQHVMHSLVTALFYDVNACKTRGPVFMVTIALKFESTTGSNSLSR